MRQLFIISMTFVSTYLYGQTNCICGKHEFTLKEKPDTIIVVNKTTSYSICGWIHKESGKTLFSEFSLTKCGDDRAIMGFSAVDNYTISVSKDTLILTELKVLPNNADLNFVSTPWTYLKIRKTNEKDVEIIPSINNDIKRLSETQKKFIINKYQELSKNKELADDDILGLLFRAAISGYTEAEEIFKTLPNVFLLDGAYLENYKELTSMLEHWHNNQ